MLPQDWRTDGVARWVRLIDPPQHELETVLRMLAILSAIYMPATLIAGINGMNFERIPMTEVPYGWFIVMVIMLAVVAGQFRYFSRRGWFKSGPPPGPVPGGTPRTLPC